MPSVSLTEALEQMTREIETGLDDRNLVAVYNSLLPGDPAAREKLARDRGELTGPLVEYVRGIDPVDDPATLAEVFQVVFIDYRRVEYNEEDDRIHYREPRRRLATG